MRLRSYTDSHWLNFLILSFLGTGLLAMSWQKWTNIIWDYGRELYTPWRITCGQVLYRDIASLFGPFPPYLNALLFKVFGVSLMTLIIFNIAVVAVIAVLIYRFFVDTLNSTAALFSSAAFLVLFAFQQRNSAWDQGDFAYICPYSYSVTYGLFLSLWALDFFGRQGCSGKDFWWFWIGLMAGLTALCRLEIFMCLSATIILGLIVRAAVEKWRSERILRGVFLTASGFAIPVGIAYWYFSKYLSLPEVWPSLLGFNEGWRQVMDSQYYQFMFGLSHKAKNLMLMMATAAGYALVVLTALCWSLVRKRAGFLLLALAGTAGAMYWILFLPYDDFFKGLPIFMVVLTGYFSFRLIAHQKNRERLWPLWAMSVWASLMLLKVLFRAQIDSEGFVYLMPGVMLFVGVLMGGHVKERQVQIFSAVFLTLLFWVGLKNSLSVYEARRFSIESGGDKVICNIFSDPQIAQTAEFIRQADNLMDKNAGFAVVREGLMLNFLTKRPNPLRYVSLRPAEVVKFGEQTILQSFRKHKPDYVLLSNQWIPADRNPKSHYPFAVREWVLANYRPAWPADGTRSSFTVFKRIK